MTQSEGGLLLSETTEKRSPATAPLDHPLVCQLLELGLPRFGGGTGQADQDVPVLAPLEQRFSQSRVSLADIQPPPLPQALLTLRRVVADPMSSLADVARVMATDPSLASYVLRLANSALYHVSSRIETLERAVTCIGLAEIETMAIGAMARKLFREPPRSDLLCLPDFWRHAVSVGLLASALAEYSGIRGKERFFVAGLLHDMGRLLLAIAEPDLSAMALLRARDERESLDVAERLVLGFDHAALGGRICRKWQLPGGLIEAVAFHHDPASCPDKSLVAVVHVADYFANALGLRSRPAQAMPRLDVSALSSLGLTEADPPRLLDALASGLETMLTLFTEDEN